MHAATLSFRVEQEFAEHTKSVANTIGLKISDYIREAVREKNERMMAERIAMLSKKLSATHVAFNESIEDTLPDGLS